MGFPKVHYNNTSFEDRFIKEGTLHSRNSLSENFSKLRSKFFFFHPSKHAQGDRNIIIRNPQQTQEEFIAELIADKEKFNLFLYTDWRTAVQKLKARENCKVLEEYIKKNLPGGIPSIMQHKKSMVFARALATPNYEMHRFMTCSDVLTELQPLIFEFTRDKFCSVNTFKQSLGKLQMCQGFNKNNEPLIHFKTIIDFNKANGKTFESIKTYTGESLTEYHKRKYLEHFPHMGNSFFNLSDWSEVDGKTAKQWYKKFLTLFLKDAVLFENFVTQEHEIEITKDIVLPAISEIEDETGYKPLIVALQTPSIEGHRFWESYPHTFIP
jgi:hypothetical protein